MEVGGGFAPGNFFHLHPLVDSNPVLFKMSATDVGPS